MGTSAGHVASRARQGSRQINRFDRRCWRCNRKGHLQRNCSEKSKHSGSENASDADVTIATRDIETETKTEVLSVSESRSDDTWVLDSGCTFHMTPNKEWFTDYQPYSGGRVLMGNNAACQVIGIGSVQIQTDDGIVRTISNVRHIPDLKRNLMSLGSLEESGFEWKGKNGQLKVTKGSLVFFKGRRQNGLYMLRGKAISGRAALGESSKGLEYSRLWHMRLAHMSDRGLQILSKRGLLGKGKMSKTELCEGCIFGKQKRVSFATAVHRTKGVLDYIHSDLWGPASEDSVGGSRYMLLFIDDFSRKVWPYFLKTKDQVFSKFTEWKALVEKQTGRCVKRLRTDNGLEFCNRAFDEFCRKEGIQRHHTVTYTPQQNGVAERMNRTILERVRSMLSTAKMGEEFWAEAANTACYIINRSPHSGINLKTPEEMWSGRPANYDNLRIFGCPAYVAYKKGKLDARSKKCIFLGYGDGVKGYRLWYSDTEVAKVIIGRDVIFDEQFILRHHEKTQSEPTVVHEKVHKEPIVERKKERSKNVVELHFDPADQGTRVEGTSRDSSSRELSSRETSSSTPSRSVETEEINTSSATESSPSPRVRERVREYSIARDRERRVIRPPQEWWKTSHADIVAYALSTAEDTQLEAEPDCFRDVVNRDDKDQWLGAMNEEMASLKKNKTWKLVELPKGKRVVQCKWIYKKKDQPDSDNVKFKARLVAKGFTQREGVDFNEIFSPVVKHTSIRVLLALVALNGLHLHQLDVKTAFLHGELEEDIYMRQPEGFVDVRRPDYVCKLQRSLYGLKQSPRQWNKRFNAYMEKCGFQRSDYDSCIYMKSIDGELVYLLLYVDDMLIAAQSLKNINKIKDMLNREFDMKDLGEARKILGMEIFYDMTQGVLHLSQRKYAEKVLQKFNMAGSTSVSTPIANHFKLSWDCSPETEDEVEDMRSVPYSSAVGSLMYLMVCTRPDMAYGMSLVSRYMSNPGQEHWKAVKWILRYLRGTTDIGLTFTRDGQRQLEGFVDADYAKDLDERRSLSGYVFTFGDSSISWKANLQSTVALSTTEAEFMAVVEGIKEALWLQGLLTELGVTQEHNMIHCDSQSAIHISKDPRHHEKTKHIDVRHYFVRRILADGKLRLLKIPTEENPADMLTKPLPTNKFDTCMELVGVLRKE